MARPRSLSIYTVTGGSRWTPAAKQISSTVGNMNQQYCDPVLQQLRATANGYNMTVDNIV